MTDIQKALRERYKHIHPLLFLRSMERAKTDGELFDLLDTMPNEYPLVWDEKNHLWCVTEDLMQSNEREDDEN